MLDTRSNEPELLDGLDVDARSIPGGLRLCAMANRFLGGARVGRRFLKTEFAQAPMNRTLRVLDIGSGDGRLPLALSRWARQRGRDVEFVCLERHPDVARLAQQAAVAAGDSRVRVVEGDVFTHEPDEPYDCAIGSLFFHHLNDERILELLERLRTFVRRSVLVNDLRRCAACYIGSVVVSLLLTPTLRHDVVLSIRRGFRRPELTRLLARLKGVSVSITRHWFCRLAGVVRFDGGERRDCRAERLRILFLRTGMIGSQRRSAMPRHKR